MTTYYTLEEWRAEAERRGNGDKLDAPMRCPLCGNVATPRQFQDAGADPERAATNCIGRVVGSKGTLHSRRRPVPQPCDWTAGGLFGTLGRGNVVVLADGRELDVFPFAEEQQAP